MPWPAVALLVGIVAAILLPAALIFGDRTSAAVVGLVAGVFGAILSPRHQVPWPLLLGAVCVGLIILFPSRPALFVLMALISVAAGREAVTTGGRSGVMALFMATGLHLIPTMPDAQSAALPALATLGAGWGVMQLTPLAGIATQAPAPRKFGIGLALFLVAGLAIAVFAMDHIHQDFAHWLAMLFVLRGLAQPGQVVRGALRFGLGATAGSLAALALLALTLPQTVTLALAAGLILLGLRLLPHPAPYAPAAFSMSVLLATAPGTDAAVFRIEAAVFAVLVSTALATLFSVIWAAVERVQARI